MVKTNSFVIKKHDFRETDRIYTVYTEELGKISLLVRSARKIKSKLAPGLENFDEVRLNFIKGKIFNHLAGWSTVTRNNKILKDTISIQFSYECLSLLDKFIKPDEKDENVFALVREVLIAINHTDQNQFPKISIYFFWRFIDLLGYRPQLEGCALCTSIFRHCEERVLARRGNPVNNTLDIRFNITDNIIICSKCAGQGILIKEDTLDKLKKVFNLRLEEFLQIEVGSELIGITNKAKQIKLSEL